MLGPALLDNRYKQIFQQVFNTLIVVLVGQKKMQDVAVDDLWLINSLLTCPQTHHARIWLISSLETLVI
jgi:hypothetical protein